jgi:hypothetical protein
MIKSGDNTYSNDPHAFMIQLDDCKIFKVRNSKCANSYWNSWILCIGGGGDIALNNNCN